VGASATEVWAACSFGTLLTYDGTTWVESIVKVGNTDVTNHLNGIWYAPDSGALYLTGFSYYLLTRQPSGEWTNSSVAGFTTMYRIWGRSSTDFYMTDFGGSVHHWDGTRFFTSTVASGRSLPGLYGLASGETYAVGLEGGAFHSNAGTQAWDIDLRGDGNDIYALWGTAGDNLELLAAGGKAYHYNGSDFLNYTVNVNTRYYGMWGASEGEVYSVGWGGADGHGVLVRRLGGR